MPLNYYAINKVLGASMVPAARPRFGGFGLLATVGSALAKKPREPRHIPFDYDKDSRVVEAFEAVREGMAPERVLWDVALARRFHTQARKLGVHAPASQMNRRLIAIRKAPARYGKHGIKLQPSSVVDPQPSVVPEFAHVLEFALVRLRNRYGASIDDILIEPKLVREYEQLARTVAHLSSKELRLGALYIRKTRYVAKDDLKLFDDLESAKIESVLDDLGTLNRIELKLVPEGEGLLEVLENKHYLYISRSENLHSVVKQFLCGPTLKMMANDFWSPRPAAIRMRMYRGSSFMNTTIKRWQLKLIHEMHPVFNLPLSATAGANGSA